MEDNMMRSESILILPRNTLRLTDMIVQMEIDNARGRLLEEKFDDTILKLVSRRNKDLSFYNRDVNKELIDELYEKNFHKYYELAPKTLMYEIINIMINQKFIKKTIVLFSNDKAVEETYSCDYYDGTIDSLEKYMISNNITCLVFDDIELLKELNDRKNIDLNNKTFIIPKLGYNYYRDDFDRLRVKYYDEIKSQNPKMEFGIIDLYDFSKETIERFRKKENKQNDG